MSEEFKILLGAELDTSALSGIQAQLKGLGDNNKIKLTIDTADVSNQLNTIKSQINSLSKVKITLGSSFGGGLGGSTSGAVNQMNWAYKQMLDIQKNIGNLKLKIGGLDSSKNTSEIQELTAQLHRLEVDYKTIQKTFNSGDLSVDQWGKLQAVIESTSDKLSQLDAKVTDTKTQLANSISTSLDNGDFSKSIASVEANMSKLSTVSTSLQSDFTRLNELIQSMGSSGSDDKLIADYQEYEQVLKRVNNQLVEATKNQQTMANAQKLSDAKNNLSLDMDVWLSKNTAAANQFGARINTLKSELQSCDSVRFNGIKSEFQSLTKEAQLAGKTGLTFASTLKSNLSSMMQYVTPFMAVMKVYQTVSSGISEIYGLDTALVDLKKTTTATSTEFENFYLQSNEIAKSLGATTQEVIQTAADWSRLGYSLKEATDLSQYSSIFSSISPEMDITAATDGMVSTMKAFGIESSKVLDGILSKVNAVGNGFALSNEDVMSALQVGSSAMAAANNSLDETIALITAGTEITQNATLVGNGLRTISMRIRGMNEETEELDDNLVNIKGDVAELTNGKVSIMEDADTYKSTYQVLKEVSDVWDELTDKNQANLLEKLFGKTRAQVGAAVISNFQIAENAMDTMANSAGNAMEEMNVIYDSLEYKLNAFKETAVGIAQNLFPRDSLKGIVDFGTGVLSVIDAITDGIGGLETVGIILGGVLGAKGVGLSIPLMGNLANGIYKVAASFGLASGAATTFSMALSGMMAVGAIIGIVKLIDAIVVTAKEANEKMESSFSAYEEAKSKVENVNSELETTSARIDELTAKGSLTFVEQAELEKLKETNAQLLIQKDLLEKQEIIAAKQSANDTVKAYEKNYGKYDISAESTEEHLKNAQVFNNNAALIANEKDISANIAAIKQYKDLQDDALKIGNTEDYQHFLEINQSIEDSIWEQVSALSVYKSNLEAIPFDQLSTDQKSALTEINDTIEYVYQQLDPETWKQIKFDEIFDDSSFSKAKDELVKIAEASENVGITVDDVKSKYPELAKAVEDAGFSVQDLVDNINSDAGIKNLEQLEKQIKKTFKDDVEQDVEIGVDIKEGTIDNFNKWIDSLSDEDLVILYDIKANQDTVGWSLDDWQNAFTKAKSGAESATSSIEELSASLEIAKTHYSNLLNAIKESVSATGLSADSIDNIKDMYRSLDGYDSSTLFEKTANGVHLNTSALRELQAQYEANKKLDYAKELVSLGDQYDEVSEKIKNFTGSQEDLELLKVQQTDLASDIEQVSLLAAQYDGLTSSYNKWVQAQSMGEEGDMYDSVTSGLKNIKELYNQGLVGTNEFRAAVQLMSNEDLSTANIDQLIAAYDSGYPKMKRYFKDSENGCINFLNDVQKLNSEWAHMNEDGSWDIDFGMGNDQEIADTLGINVESVQAVLRKLSDYGFDINLDSPIKSISELEEKIKSTESALQEMGQETVDINVNAKDLDLELDNAKSKIDEINNSDISPEVKTAQLEDAYAKLEVLIQRKVELERPSFMNIDTSSVDNSIQGALISLQNYQAAADELKYLQMYYEITGEDHGITEAQAKVDELAQKLYELPDEEKVAVGIEMTDDVETIKSKIANNEVTITASVEADATTIGGTIKNLLNKASETTTVNVNINTTGEDKINSLKSNIDSLTDKTVTVTTNATNGENVGQLKLAMDNLHDKIVNVSATSTGNNDVGNLKTSIDSLNNKTVTAAAKVVGTALVNMLKRAIDGLSGKTVSVGANVFGAGAVNSLRVSINSLRDKIVNVTSITRSVGGGKAQGTAYANGTTNKNGSAFVKGDWGTKENGVALGGELGQELVVRDGRFFTIGDKSAEFFSYQKGDIIFNAKQTKEIFEKGKITGGSGRGKALAEGTAFSSGSGTFRRKSTSSSSSGSSGSSKSFGGSSSSSSGSGSSSSSEETKETFDWITVKISRLERAIEQLNKKATNVYKSWSSRNSNLVSEISKVTSEVTLQQQAYDRYIQQANSIGLSSAWSEKVRNGVVDISTLTDKDLIDKIKNYEEWYNKAIDCKDAIDDLNISLSDLQRQKFDNITTQFNGVLTQIENKASVIEGYIDQAEAKGYLVSTKYYESLVSIEKDNIKKLKEEKTALESSLLEAVKNGSITANSEAWYEMKEQIDDVTLSIQSAELNLIEFGNAIRELNWDVFDMLQDSISRITGESDFLIDLMSNEKLYDDSGQLTDEGSATMGLHGVNYNTYMEQANRYKTEMSKVQAELAKDPNNQILIDRRNELLDLQQESILAAEDEKQAIISMVKEGIKLELDALKDLIDTYTDALDAQKDLYDYQKKVAKQTKEVASLQKQMSAYANDNSEESKSKIQKLKVSLEEAKSDLEEAQYKQYISDQKQLLDELYLEYETVLNQRLDNVDALISDMIDEINASSAIINTTLQEVSSNVGYTMTTEMRSIWGNDGAIGKILTTYSGNFSSKMTSLQTTISTISTNIGKLVTASNQQAAKDVQAATSSTTSASSTATVSKPTTTTSSTTSANATKIGNFFISKKDSYPKNKLNISTSIIDRLKYRDFDSSFSARQMYYGKMGLSGTYTGSINQNTNMLSWMKANGYKTGVHGLGRDELAWTQENGTEAIVRPSDGAILTPLEKGSSVLDSNATENLWNFMKNPSGFINNNLGGQNPSAIEASAVNSSIQNDVKVAISLPNVQNYSDFVRQLQRDKTFERLIQSITVDQLVGGSPLTKYKFKFKD